MCRIERVKPDLEEDWCVARGIKGGFGDIAHFAQLVFKEPERYKIISAQMENARQAPPALPTGWWSLAQNFDQVRVSAAGAGDFHWKDEKNGNSWKSDNRLAGFAIRYFLKKTKVWKKYPGIKQWPEMLVAARPYSENVPLNLEWQVDKCSRLVLWYCISPSRQLYLQRGLCDGLDLVIKDDTGRPLLNTFIHETEWRRCEIPLSPEHKTKLQLIIDAVDNASADQVELRIEGDGIFVSP